MTEQDISFVPHSDAEIGDMPIVEEHQKLIDEQTYGDAISYLNRNNYSKGFRASLFNAIQNKIRTVQEYFLNKSAAPDEYFSYEEPTAEQMEGKTFWIQIIDD